MMNNLERDINVFIKYNAQIVFLTTLKLRIDLL